MEVEGWPLLSSSFHTSLSGLKDRFRRDLGGEEEGAVLFCVLLRSSNYLLFASASVLDCYVPLSIFDGMTDGVMAWLRLIKSY